MKKNKFITLFFFITLAQLAGLLGSIFTFSAIPTWYVHIEKPFFTPPSFLFGPVWTSLYILMGVAASLVFQKGWKKKQVRTSLKLWGIQLVLNVLWSIIFFGLQMPLLAFIEIVVLWAFIFLTMRAFAKVSQPAMWLLWPYLLWVSFASMLNLGIVLLN